MVRIACGALGVRDGTRYSRYFGVGGSPSWSASSSAGAGTRQLTATTACRGATPATPVQCRTGRGEVGRLVSQPSRGDIYGYRDNHHLGIVESVSGARFTTIDGNWSNAVSRQGGHAVGNTYFFVRL